MQSIPKKHFGAVLIPRRCNYSVALSDLYLDFFVRADYSSALLLCFANNSTSAWPFRYHYYVLTLAKEIIFLQHVSKCVCLPIVPKFEKKNIMRGIRT